MLVLSSRYGLFGSNPVVWLCHQEPVRSFQKGCQPEKAKLRRWWTYPSQLQLSVHLIQGVKNECADYISRNNFDDMIGARSEELAKEAFSRMDVHLDLDMTMIRPLDGRKQFEYLRSLGTSTSAWRIVWNPSWSTRNNGRGTRPTSGMRTR